MSVHGRNVFLECGVSLSLDHATFNPCTNVFLTPLTTPYFSHILHTPRTNIPRPLSCLSTFAPTPVPLVVRKVPNEAKGADENQGYGNHETHGHIKFC